MADQFEGVEPMVYKSRINIPYSWWAGDTAGKFFKALRDEKKIIAPRCARCGKVYLPPRKVCPGCFTENGEWVTISDEGTVLSFSIARRSMASIPKDKKTPVIWALIKLDGADTAILHFLGDVVPENVRIGMRVKAVFAEDRKGAIRDISHFRPA